VLFLTFKRGIASEGKSCVIDLMLKELKELPNVILFYFDRNVHRNTTYRGHCPELEKLSWAHLKLKSMS
jgi:hypothetical protein